MGDARDEGPVSGAVSGAQPGIRVRAEEPRDYARVFEIHTAAFEGPGEARLVDRLREVASPRVSLVAEAPEGHVIGHVFFSPVEVRGPHGRKAALALGPVGVDPAVQQRGAGAALCRAGLEACKAICPVVFVLGHATYYPRFGFEPARPHGLYYKNEHFDPAFFVVALEPGALAGLEGEVVYREEFDAV